jgi:predicted nicotinamide N-methyase
VIRVAPSPARVRAFVRRHTRLAPVPDLPGVRLHVADDVMTVCRLAGTELELSDPPLPFWAFAWAGGLAISRYLVDHPDEVAGRQVLDLASGSGLCAIVALRCGAASAEAVDVDPFSEAAVGLNAHANGVRIGFRRTDILDAPPPAVDVILAGDVCYEETMATRILDWLRVAARAGSRVLVGDPGRKYLPLDLERVATYRVRTSRELENAEIKESAVFTFPPPREPGRRRDDHPHRVMSRARPALSPRISQ